MSIQTQTSPLIEGQIKSQRMRIFVLAFIGYMLVNVDGAFFNNTYPMIQAEFGISNNQISLLFTLMNIFSAIAVFAMGPIMDRYGRRKLFIYALWLTAIGSVLTGLAQVFVTLLVFRAVVSVGSSTDQNAALVIVSETQEAKNRTFLTGLVQAAYPVGWFIAIIITKLVVPSFGWRPLFFIGVIPVLVILFMRRGVGETERFLEMKKLRDQAEELARSKHINLSEAAENVSTKYLVNKKQLGKFAYFQLFSPDLRRTTILLVLSQFVLNFGLPAIIMFLPMVVAHYNIALEGLWFITGVATGLAIPAYYLAAWLTKKYPAKYICIIFSVIGGVAGIYLALFANTLPTITIGYMLFYFFAIGQYGAAPGLLTQSFPTRVRGTGNSLCFVAIWLAYVVAAASMPVLFSTFGIPGTVLIWTAGVPFVAAMLWAGLKTIPPGQELEEIAS